MYRDDVVIPTSLNGDLRRGGWLLSGQFEGDTDRVSARQAWILKAASHSGFVDFAGRQVFNGHILGQPDFGFDRYISQATIQAGTVDAHLRGESLQSFSLADVASPANSHEATSWNFGQVVTHILQRHCNYLYSADGSAGSPDGVVTETNIDVTNSTTFQQFIVRQSNNLWASLQQIGGGEEGGGEFYRVWCDRRNVIHYQPAPIFISPKPDAKGTLTQANLRGRVQVRYNNNQPGQRVGQVQILAVGGPSTVYSSSYPATAGSGRIHRLDSGIWANSQARANVLSERLYKWLTRLYTLTVEVDAGLALLGDDGRGLDLGDRVLVTYNGPVEAGTGAGVHLNLSAASFFVYGMQVNFDPAGESATVTLTLEQDNS